MDIAIHHPYFKVVFLNMKFGYIDNQKEVEAIDFTLPTDNTLTSKTLTGERKKPLQIYIGCPVWSQAGYVGKVYPKGTKAANYLKEYCKQFNTIEVNATRYGTPKLDTIKQWKDNATEGFKFSLKVPQVISHRSNIADKEALQLLEDFIVANHELGDHMGTAFLQLSPYFSPAKKEQLEDFLDYLPDSFPISVELRHKDWFSADNIATAYDLFSTRDVGFIITDTAGRRDVMHQTLTNKSLMVRFVGQMLHPTDFTRIDNWIKKIDEWVKDGLEEVYFFMHQPEPHKYLSANLASYMIEHLTKKIPDVVLKAPIDYSINAQKSLF